LEQYIQLSQPEYGAVRAIPSLQNAKITGQPQAWQKASSLTLAVWLLGLGVVCSDM
jgi:hypothetical protein